MSEPLGPVADRFIRELLIRIDRAMGIHAEHNNGIGGFKDLCICVGCRMANALMTDVEDEDG